MWAPTAISAVGTSLIPFRSDYIMMNYIMANIPVIWVIIEHVEADGIYHFNLATRKHVRITQKPDFKYENFRSIQMEMPFVFGLNGQSDIDRWWIVQEEQWKMDKSLYCLSTTGSKNGSALLKAAGSFEWWPSLIVIPPQ